MLYASARQRVPDRAKAPNDGREREGYRLTASRKRLLTGILVWVAAAAYLLPFVDRGWIPHDEGVIAQSAERLLDGELPHRDFDEVYTGGLTVLHAMAFRLFGMKIFSLRLLLLVCALLFVPALYAVTCRFARPLAAGLVAFLGFIWSLPNHFSSMPSWYNLFCATFGTLAFLRYLENERRRWLFVAGLCSGLGVLVKLHGVFLVAAGLLFLVYREEVTAPRDDAGGSSGKWFLLLKSAALTSFCILLWHVVSNHPGEMEILHFVVPGATICAFLLWSEVQTARSGFVLRLKGLLRLLIPFLAGVAAPVLVFLIWYFVEGGAAALLRGVFGFSSNRLSMPELGVWLPPLRTFASGLLYGSFLFVPGSLGGRRWRLAAAISAALACAVVFFFSTRDAVYRGIFFSARSLAVMVVLAGCVVLVRETRSGTLPAGERQRILLVLVVAAMVSLVQFPFAAPVYFCYTAPAAAVALLAVAQRGLPGLFHLPFLLLFLFFGILRLNVGYVYNMGSHFERYEAQSELRLERAGVRVPESDRDMYEQLVATIHQKSRSGPIFAGPDCPEVYFLAERSNPTRILTPVQRTPRWQPQALLRFLHEKGVEVVVVNTQPAFSRRLPAFVVTALRGAYPQSRKIGRFTVLWKD